MLIVLVKNRVRILIVMELIKQVLKNRYYSKCLKIRKHFYVLVVTAKTNRTATVRINLEIV